MANQIDLLGMLMKKNNQFQAQTLLQNIAQEEGKKVLRKLVSDNLTQKAQTDPMSLASAIVGSQPVEMTNSVTDDTSNSPNSQTQTVNPVNNTNQTNDKNNIVSKSKDTGNKDFLNRLLMSIGAGLAAAGGNNQLAPALIDLSKSRKSTKKVWGLDPASGQLKELGEMPAGDELRNLYPEITGTNLPANVSGTTNIQTPEEMEVTGYDVKYGKYVPRLSKKATEKTAKEKGRLEGITKRESTKVEDLSKAQNNSRNTYRFLQQFGKSYEELKKFDPEIESEGFGGYISRKRGKLASAIDELPETKSLQIMIKPLANGMAREIEGGRVTDQDRQIYADSFANSIANPGATNIRLASQSIISLLDKGSDMTSQLKQLAATDIDIFNDIISQVLIEYPDLVEDIYGKGAKVLE